MKTSVALDAIVPSMIDTGHRFGPAAILIGTAIVAAALFFLIRILKNKKK